MSYTSPNATGSLAYTPVADQNGTAVVAVTVRDTGLNGTLGDADDGTVQQTFTVTVNPVADAPRVVNPIADVTVDEDADSTIIDLSGVFSDPDGEPLTFSASSTDPGLVTATALVRPSRSVLDMKAKSVKKKWKDARFAAGVDRSLIERGAELLGMPLEELIAETISGMREVAAAIGLEGGAA